MNSFAGPSEVRGRLEKLRNALQAVLIVVFLVLPWLRFRGEPLLLVDIAHRNFVIFGFRFYSHEAPLLFFFLILVLLSIFMVTAVFGRLWCGWTCPQSVFIHSVFNKIEKWILGPYVRRKVLEKTEKTVGYRVKVLSIYVLFFLVSWVLAHSFVAYFMGSEAVTHAILEGPAQHMTAFVILMIMSFILFANFSFFREKLCFFVCPYGRFQNALIDSNTVTVFYDSIRGEPRGKSVPLAERGDCVDCQRCVMVCPTKIDIRNGFQLECIACGKCIDACNDIMTKIKKPEGLVRYQTGDQRRVNLKRFRLVLYAALMLVFSSAFIWSLAHRERFDFMLTRSHAEPFSERSENTQKILQNQLQIHLKNQKEKSEKIEIFLSAHNIEQGFRILSPAVQITLAPEQDLKIPAFIEIDEERLSTQTDRDVSVTMRAESGEQIVRTLHFVGRESQ